MLRQETQTLHVINFALPNELSSFAEDRVVSGDFFGDGSAISGILQASVMQFVISRGWRRARLTTNFDDQSDVGVALLACRAQCRHYGKQYENRQILTFQYVPQRTTGHESTREDQVPPLCRRRCAELG